MDGPPSGLLALGDEVTWEARHFGHRWRLRVRVSGFNRPRWFRDEMVQGPFRRMRHDHWFDATEGGTRLRDEFEFAAVPILDELVLAPHLRRLLLKRNELIRYLAEADTSGV